MPRRLQPSALLFVLLCLPVAATQTVTAQTAPALPAPAAIDAKVRALMAQTHAKGIAVALIDHGQVVFTNAYGIRNAKGDPLTPDTVMYGASLTKTVFAHTVLQLVDQHKLSLDLGDLTQACFTRLGMTHSSLTFLNGHSQNYFDGWDDKAPRSLTRSDASPAPPAP